MHPVRLVESERSKPLSYDPSSETFLYLDDVKAGRRFSPAALSEEQQRMLVSARYELEEESIIESLEVLDKRQQLEHIRSGTEVGARLVSQEITFLTELIDKIDGGIVY